MKKPVTASNGFHCICFSCGMQGVTLQGLRFFEKKGCQRFICWPGIPDLHRMLLLCNPRITMVIINTWRRVVRVVKSSVITRGVMCWRMGCGFRMPGSAQPAELPWAEGNPLQGLCSSPRRSSAAPIRVLPNTEPLLLGNRENKTLPLWNVVIQPPDQNLSSCTCSLASLCLSPAAQRTGLSKGRAAVVQSDQRVSAWSYHIISYHIIEWPAGRVQRLLRYRWRTLDPPWGWSNPSWLPRTYAWASIIGGPMFSPDVKYTLFILQLLFFVTSETPQHEDQMWHLLSHHPFTHTQTINLCRTVL